MQKVVVGMSGGVDSAVAAYLLKEQGYQVIGVFMQNWDPALNNDLADPYIDSDICQAQEDFNDAKIVAKQLGIELYKVDFIKEYWEQVFKYFLEQHQLGRTPNPDVFCNKYIKFDAFLKYAIKNFNCDYIAMGHYARIVHQPQIKLLKSYDENKDQTYFLEQVDKKMLVKTLFPLGDLTKQDVRKIASGLDLKVAHKKDSTGICFIGERNFRRFLTNYLQEQPGDFVDIKTKQKVAKHKGMMYYTIGQRSGLDIGGNAKFGNQKWFVVSKNVESNIVYIAQGKDNKWLKSDQAIVENINYLADDFNLIKTAKFRYRSKEVIVNQIKKINDKTILIDYQMTIAVTPGQACVFYHNQWCLGGGEISKVSFKGENRAYENSNNN